MYLHFSDWSMFMKTLDKKGIPHGDKIIKIYALEKDPKEVLQRPSLYTHKVDDMPFREDETFSYEERGSYTGPELKAKLTEMGLNEDGKRYARALFRFSNLPEIQSCQYMMSAKNPDGCWMFSNPFDDIDGLDRAAWNPARNPALHLDIFSEQSLARLRQIVNIDNSELLVPWGREIMKLISPERVQTLEGSPSKVEF